METDRKLVYMSTITPNADQEKAIKLAKEWWSDKNERYNRPFVLAGYAGTGKTTTLNLILEELGLEYGDYISIAFTGMAATVLRKKKYLASTIHRFIYDVIPLKNGKFKFERKTEVQPYKLIVIDEVGQVSLSQLEDIQHFGIPILVMGDAFQTRQIGGKDNGLLDKPDFTLTKTMRQSLDNPILWLATRIREGHPIELGTYGDNLWVMKKEDIPVESYGQVDQIITTTNKSVNYLNNLVRQEVYGLESQYPYVGEKLMILKNNWNQTKISEDGIEMSPVNGLNVLVESIGDYDPVTRTFKITVKDMATGIVFDEMNADAVYFEDGLKDDSPLYENPEYKQLLFKRKTAENTNGFLIDKMNFGYCSTTYKLQGSEFSTGIYIKDRWYCPNEDYTSVTRVSDKLLIGI